MSFDSSARRCALSVACMLWSSFALGAAPTDWALPQLAYRVAVVVDPGGTPRTHAPVGVEIDFAQLCQSAGIMG